MCAGLSKRVQSGEAPSLPADAVPGGDFRYLCIGYSAYDREDLKRAARKRCNPTDPVQLPYCEGLEVVSAAAMSTKPELLTGGPALEPPPSAPEGNEPSARPRPGRTFGACFACMHGCRWGKQGAGLLHESVSLLARTSLLELCKLAPDGLVLLAVCAVPAGDGQGPGEVDWERFKERFDRTAQRIAAKMASNAAFMAVSLRKSWEQAMKEVSGRGSDKGGDKGAGER